MSADALDLVREMVAAWNRHDLERWLGCWHRTCEWVPELRGQVEGAQTYRGHEGLRRYWMEDEAVWDGFNLRPTDFQQQDDEVIAICTGTARGKGSGVEVTAPFALRFRVREGKIVRGQSYFDIDAALKRPGPAG